MGPNAGEIFCSVSAGFCCGDEISRGDKELSVWPNNYETGAQCFGGLCVCGQF